MSWGFDNGGFIYRQASSSPVYNPATLPGTPAAPPVAAIPDTNVAISYANPTTAFGYSCNATGPGELEGRPYATDSTFGAGHSTVLGSDPWYRSWVDVEWRMALNGALYPTGASIPAGPARRTAVAEPASKPIAKKALPKVKDRPVIKGVPAREDARVVVEPATSPRSRAPPQGRRSEVRAPQGRVGHRGRQARPGLPQGLEAGVASSTRGSSALGIVTKGSTFADTNIPGRSH